MIGLLKARDSFTIDATGREREREKEESHLSDGVLRCNDVFKQPLGGILIKGALKHVVQHAWRVVGWCKNIGREINRNGGIKHRVRSFRCRKR